jgi:DNA recombination protein RmuC
VEPIALVVVLLLVVLVVLGAAVLVVVLRRGAGGGAAVASAAAGTQAQLAALQEQLAQARELLDAQQQSLAAQQQRLSALDADFARSDALLREEFARSRTEAQAQAQAAREENTRAQQSAREEASAAQAGTREELAKSFSTIQQSMDKRLAENRETVEKGLAANREAVEKGLGENREAVEQRLTVLQQSNEARLEQMRVTVDEKLQQTVERRFAESFKLISNQLEQVHKGLGEMQTLAGGVSDLKKVLSNVKTRGNLGEYQLGAILEQVLSPEQYETNAAPKPRSQERVEFAVRLPSKDDDNSVVLLPIDSKFPVEDYERLLDAYEGTSEESAELLAARLEARILVFARDIRDKYINPPRTTDFAIMFVPTEGLYAEVLRRPGLFERLQRDFRVIVAGPTNLVALLNSLQMGFRTLAIEKRTSEVWKTLGAVKTEFGRFAGLLDGVRRKLDSASNDIERIGSKSRNISRKLGKVQELPMTEAAGLLGPGGAADDAADDADIAAADDAVDEDVTDDAADDAVDEDVTDADDATEA